MTRHARFAVVWLLALLMPFQALTAVYLDVRGPAHFHVESHHDDHRHDRGSAGERNKQGHYYLHFHERHDIERHHHHPHDSSVVTVGEHAPLGFFALKQETTSGWSGVMLAAVLASSILLLLAKMAGGLTPRPEPRLQSRFPGRLERPPRIVPT